MKVNRKYSTLLTALFMTLAMDSTMTFAMNTIMTGWTPGFPQRLLGGWAIGFAVGLPTSLLVIPFVRKLVNKLASEC
jgi:membrane protein implicated in regulation of membrane protease activity